MSTYAEIKAQIADLEKKAHEARSSEITSAKAQIAEIMKTYGLSLSDLEGSAKPKSYKVRQSVAAKYRSEETGATWTGRGRAPLWLAGKNKDDFLIE